MRTDRMPTVPVTPESVVLGGGLDLISPPGYAKLGTARFSLNYEAVFGGGYRRVGGFERFDGRFRPHLAEYVLLEASAGFTGVALGDTVTGVTSGATGKVIYVTATQVGVTRVSATPFTTEVLNVGGSPVGTVTEDQPTITGFVDNELASLAADDYRADILKPAGLSGPIRGVAVLGTTVYCWIDNAGNLETYKSTSSGWTLVPLFSQISFDGGSAEYADGSTLTQGGSSATVKRVVLESGDWTAGTAAGRMIVAPISGTFAAGAAGGGGVCNLLGAAAVITQFAGGRVSSVVYNFTASLSTKRLYCCDGVNLEWEFDGTVIVPLTTGMGGIRATAVAAHKNHLFYAYRSGVQHSAIGLPYVWSAVLGAGELGTGDTITNLLGVSGSETNAALMVMCQDSVWVLYGSDVDSWQFTRVAEEAGAQAYSAAEMVRPIAFDREGFVNYSPTDTFGNFSYESASRNVDPLVRGAIVKCSVLAKNKSNYRCFFSDGLFVSGTPGKQMEWMPCDYGRVIECIVGAEISGEYRIFMGDSTGWVLEADVGRSFDGDVVTANMRMSSQNQRSPQYIKQYRLAEADVLAESAFEISMAAEFSDAEADLANTGVPSTQDSERQYGVGLFWDFASWDRAYWDVTTSSRLRFDIHGQGRSVSLLVFSESATELPHTLKNTTVTYTPRRLAR
jgi:hypothetical protein